MKILSRISTQFKKICIQRSPFYRIWTFLGAIILLVIFLNPSDTLAQEIDRRIAGWSENTPLLEPADPDGSQPRIAVDRQGRAHIFWVSEYQGDSDDPGSSQTVIRYRLVDGDRMSTTNDILASATLGTIIIGDVKIDDRDVINVLWVDQDKTRNLFLSQAHVNKAGDARSWKTQVLEIPTLAMGDPFMQIEPGGKSHLVYALDNRSIDYRQSSDYGSNWSEPVTIAFVNDPLTEAVASPRIAADEKGYLHAVWSEAQESRDWNVVAVNYARSTDGGVSWSNREVMRSSPDEPTTGWINVVVRDGNEIHLVWNRGVGSLEGRHHMWSADNGDSWSTTRTITPPNVNGQTQWPLMVVDSASNIHLITVADNGPAGTIPIYMRWDGTSWGPMITFPETTNDLNVALAIGLGNRLHLVHAEERGRGRLLYNTMLTDAAPIPSQVIPDPKIELVEPSEEVPVSIQTSASGQKTSQIFESEPAKNAIFSRSSALIIPVILVVLLLGIVVVRHARGGQRN